MNLSHSPGARYRMPTHFGPMPGPRQGPDGRPFAASDSPHRATLAIDFLTDAAALRELTPRRLELHGEPIVTIEATYLTQIAWLAGRGYAMCGVRWPVRFTGTYETVTGSFLAVLWENLADPILSGREELGFSKLFAEIPPPRVLAGARHITLGWMGFGFLKLSMEQAVEIEPGGLAKARGPSQGAGLLHHRYFPSLAEPGAAAVDEFAFTPSGGPGAARVTRAWRAEGSHRFATATWEDLPTLHHIVAALGALPVRAPRGAWWTEAVGGSDLSDQRVLA